MPSTGPLAGMRVVDLADEKGELCGRMLADLGADVVRVEPPSGAGSRRLPPFAPDGVSSLYFAYRNFNKRGVCLELQSPEVRRLLTAADIVIESFPPGHLDAIGLGPSVLLRESPALVVTSITDFGQTGPYRDYAGTDMTGLAMGGLMGRSGLAGKPPLAAPGALAYDIAGVTAAFATLMACLHRLRTGEGQHLDVSVMESVANIDWAMPPVEDPPAGARGPVRNGPGAVYPIYPCGDGYVRLVQPLTRKQWEALRAWMGEPEELQGPELYALPGRLAKAAEVVPRIHKLLEGRKKVDLALEGQHRGIAVTPMLEPGEAMDNEHVIARGTFANAEVLEGVHGRFPTGFLHVDGEWAGFRTRAPGVGEHTGLVLEELDGARRDKPPAPLRTTYPFEGLRVLDFGVGAVGVEVGRLLAEYGADVIKIETRTAPDFMRAVLGGMTNPSFASSSRSKRSFGVNAKTEQGRQIIQRLVELCDVIVENGAKGAIDKLGADYETVRRINPRAVMVSSQLMGSTGPWSDWIGYGPSTRPVAALSYLWNYPDGGEPAESSSIHPDHFAGRVAAVGALAALVQRERTGAGAHVDAAQFEAILCTLGDLLLQESLQPGSVRPVGNESPRGVPWGAFPCIGEDAWCVINVGTDAEWERLRAAIGDPEWARKDAYTTVAGRLADRAALERMVGEWTSQLQSRQVMELLQREGVPASMVPTVAQLGRDPHLAERGFYRPVEQPPLGTIRFQGAAFRGSRLPEPVVRAAPGLGEHTREICRDLLGMQHSEIDALVADGVLEEASA